MLNRRQFIKNVILAGLGLCAGSTQQGNTLPDTLLGFPVEYVPQKDNRAKVDHITLGDFNSYIKPFKFTHKLNRPGRVKVSQDEITWVEIPQWLHSYFESQKDDFT